jgi:hypothetical protein
VKRKPDVEVVETGEIIAWDKKGDELVKRLKARPLGETGYSRARWQTDAAGMWRSSGDRVLEPADLLGRDWKEIYRLFRGFSYASIYDHEARSR